MRLLCVVMFMQVMFMQVMFRVYTGDAARTPGSRDSVTADREGIYLLTLSNYMLQKFTSLKTSCPFIFGGKHHVESTKA